MKKIFSFILTFIFFIIPVKADVTTCDNYLISSSLSFQKWNNTWHGFIYNDSSTGYCIPYTSIGQTFYFKFFPTDTMTFDRNSFLIRNVSNDSNSGTTIISNTNMDNTTYIFSGTISSGSGCLRHAYIATDSFFVPIEGTPLLMSTNLSDIENCTLAPDTPPEPPTPPASTFFSDFLSVFTDRLSFLATSFTNEPALFCFIVIILAFIVLELFLKLIKGGRR